MNNLKKYAINTSVAVAAAIVITVLVNIFVTVLTDKFPLKIDLTTNKMYELSDKTKDFLENYNMPADIYILAGESEQDTNIRAVLDKYAALNSNIKITNINIASNPTFGKKYLTGTAKLQANSVIVDGGEKFKMYTMNDLYGVNAQSGLYTSLNVENRITSALRYISTEEDLNAYLVKGHNEMTVSGAADFLTEENYTVKEINTLTENVPEDAGLLIIAKPTVDFSKEEISKLDSYLTSGGNVQVYFDVECRGLTNLFTYLKSVWGMSVSDDIVIETNTSRSVMLPGSSMGLVVPVVEQSEFTDSIIKNQRTLAYFPYAKAVRPEFETKGDISVMPLLSSSDNSYTTTNYENVSKTGNETEEKYTVAALAQDKKNGSSVYVSGCTMLLSVEASTLTNNYGLANYDYFMNLINYTLGNDEGFAVGEKALADNVITISQSAEKIIFAVVVILIPAVVLIAGVFVWIKRRHL